MKGVIYTRVSSDEQVAGTSLDFQEESCRAYCEGKGIAVQELFREEGVSAKSAERPMFLRAIEYCRKNKVEAFVVAKVDRFARNTEDHFAIRKRLLSYGTKLHSVTEPIGSDPSEKLFETILAGFSDFDNAIRKQRCTDGMSAKINQGIWPWKPPVGYLCKYYRKQGKKKTAPDEKDPATFYIIQQALQEYSLGIHNKAALVRRLDELGLAEALGRKTYKQFVGQLLAPKRLKYYAGTIENPWTGKDVLALHEAMITKEEYERIDALETGRKPVHTKKLKRNPKFPLRRTLICTGCNTFLSASSPRGKCGVYYHYYHCIKRDCPRYAKHMKRDQVEEDFKELLQRVLPSEQALGTFKERVLQHFEKWKSAQDRREATYNKVRAALAAQKARIYEMREDGSYSAEEFRERKQVVEDKLTQLEEARERSGGLSKIEDVLDKALSFLTEIVDTWSTLGPTLRHEFQKLIFPDGICYNPRTGFGTPNLGCLFRAFQGPMPRKSFLVHSTSDTPKNGGETCRFRQRAGTSASVLKADGKEKGQQIEAWDYAEWRKFLEELETWVRMADVMAEMDKEGD